MNIQAIGNSKERWIVKLTFLGPATTVSLVMMKLQMGVSLNFEPELELIDPLKRIWTKSLCCNCEFRPSPQETDAVLIATCETEAWDGKVSSQWFSGLKGCTIRISSACTKGNQSHSAEYRVSGDGVVTETITNDCAAYELLLDKAIVYSESLNEAFIHIGPKIYGLLAPRVYNKLRDYVLLNGEKGRLESALEVVINELEDGMRIYDE